MGIQSGLIREALEAVNLSIHRNPSSMTKELPDGALTDAPTCLPIPDRIPHAQALQPFPSNTAIAQPENVARIIIPMPMRSLGVTQPPLSAQARMPIPRRICQSRINSQPGQCIPSEEDSIAVSLPKAGRSIR